MAMLFDDGFSAFDDRLAAIEEKGASKMDKFVAQEAEVIIGKIKDNTPTRTGRLKNGWKHSRAIQGKTTIYNNVKYAAHVEYGHRQTPGRYVPAIGKRLKKDFVPGKKMMHKGMMQSGKTFRDDAKQIMENIFGDD